jgi:hypothetical protein
MEACAHVNGGTKMDIQGISPTNSPAPVAATLATADALKTAAQKLSDTRAEANAGITDGDEGSGSGKHVNASA